MDFQKKPNTQPTVEDRLVLTTHAEQGYSYARICDIQVLVIVDGEPVHERLRLAEVQIARDFSCKVLFHTLVVPWEWSGRLGIGNVPGQQWWIINTT